MEDPYPSAAQLFSRKILDVTENYKEWERLMMCRVDENDNEAKLEATEANLKAVRGALLEATALRNGAADMERMMQFGVSEEEGVRRRQEAQGYYDTIIRMSENLRESKKELERAQSMKTLASSMSAEKAPLTQAADEREARIRQQMELEEREKYNEIDEGMEELVPVLQRLKRYGETFGDELDKQDQKITDLRDKMDVTNDKIKDSNSKMKVLMKKMGKRKPCVMILVGGALIILTIILVVVL